MITLSDASAEVIDEVEYPEMGSNVSLARYGDANATFYFNSFPDVGEQNLDNGVVDPDLRFLHVSPVSPRGGEPLKFIAEASDDIGLASLAVYWRRLDGTAGEDGWVPLYDDGMHGDGGMLDGRFAGTLASGFPDGAEVEFYIRGIDLSDAETTLPGAAIFTTPGLSDPQLQPRGRQGERDRRRAPGLRGRRQQRWIDRRRGGRVGRLGRGAQYG